MVCLLTKCVFYLYLPMITELNDILIIINIILYFCVFKEIRSLPSISDTLTTLLNIQFNIFISYLLSAITVLILPMVAITGILGMLKNQIFSSSKCIKTSWVIANKLLVTTYLLRIFKMLFVLFTKLSLSDPFYVYIRIAKYNHSITSYLTQYDFYSSVLFHVAVFIVGFMIAEFKITYYMMTIQTSYRDFCIKNTKIIGFTTIITFFYIVGIILLEKGIGLYKKSISNVFALLFGRLYESVIICGLCLYLYTIVITQY